jgi:hypothetical protein
MSIIIILLVYIEKYQFHDVTKSIEKTEEKSFFVCFNAFNDNAYLAFSMMPLQFVYITSLMTSTIKNDFAIFSISVFLDKLSLVFLFCFLWHITRFLHIRVMIDKQEKSLTHLSCQRKFPQHHPRQISNILSSILLVNCWNIFFNGFNATTRTEEKKLMLFNVLSVVKCFCTYSVDPAQ